MGTAAPILLFLAAVALGLAAARELLGGRGEDLGGRSQQALDPARERRFTERAAGIPGRDVLAAALFTRLGLEARLARSGLADRVSVPAVFAAKLAGALIGLLVGAAAAPAAPGRVALLVGLGMPVAGFLGPDAWLERRARARMRALRAALPDALDLLAVGTAAGRSPSAGMAELGTGEGPWRASSRCSQPRGHAAPPSASSSGACARAFRSPRSRGCAA